jgi:hypothetical protein
LPSSIPSCSRYDCATGIAVPKSDVSIAIAVRGLDRNGSFVRAIRFGAKASAVARKHAAEAVNTTLNFMVKGWRQGWMIKEKDIVEVEVQVDVGCPERW